MAVRIVILLLATIAVSFRSVGAQSGCSCTVSLISGPNNYTAVSSSYNTDPSAGCTCSSGFSGICQNLGSAAQSQTTNANGTVTYTAQGTCSAAPARQPTVTPVLPASPPTIPVAAPPVSATPPANTPPPSNAPPPVSPPPFVPPTNAPPPLAPPPASPPPFVPPTNAPPPQPASPPVPPPVRAPPPVPPPIQAPPPQPASPPVPVPPVRAPPSPAPPVPPVPPPTPSTPGNIVNNNSGNSNITNISNTNITNISNTVTNINNTVTNNIVTNINNPPAAQSTPGTVSPSPPPAVSPPTPPTPVTSVTTGASVPPVPVVTPPPAPPTPPQCGVQPQCRIFTENKLCCQDQGILSEAQYSSTWILCTHDVQLPQTCLSVGGPANLSVSPFFTQGTVGTNFNYALTWNTTAPYIGKVTIDLESARTVRPECTLDISPCIFNGQTVTTVQPVTPLTFSVINPLAFQLGYVGLPATNLDTLDSFAWTDPSNSTACFEQSRINLVKGSSFGYSAQTFVSQPGYKVPCSPEVTFNAILPNAQQLTTLPSSGVAGIAP